MPYLCRSARNLLSNAKALPAIVAGSAGGHMKLSSYVALCSALALVACGKTDVSGIYLFASEREVTMVQLIQSPDGKLTGRIQSDFIDTDGKVAEKSAAADGAISGNDLVLKPASAWYGGVQASGTIKGSNLTLSGEGFTLNATRSSLDDFQKKVAALQSTAAEQRQKLAKSRAAAAQAQAEADMQRNLAAQASQVTDRVAAMRNATLRLANAIDRSPNFGQAAAANTAKIARMASAAPSMSELARGQLGVAASQIEVGTNQIEVQRTQYANGLNQLVSDITDNAAQIARICGKAPALPLVASCDSAKVAANEFKAIYERGKLRFTPYKAQVEAEIAKQDSLIRRIDN